MSELASKTKSLARQITKDLAALKIDELSAQKKQLEAELAQPGVWNNVEVARTKSQQLAAISQRVDPWRALEEQVRDIEDMLQLNDAALEGELVKQLADAEKVHHALQQDLLFNGPYDDHNAILRLSAGVGGTDAQDWTEMLLRMYLRWAEKANLKTEIIEESKGEEAGIKTVVVGVQGPHAYGKLHGEHGVHRLVRLSPFNADNLRQTSFALVEVLPQIDTPDEVQLDDKDLKIDVFRAGGHGGQSVNTTDSAVRITHLPTGIVVSIQNERSQLQNKETAMKILRSKLAQLQIEQHKETLADLKGPSKSAEWGAQIRNYVLHPYTLVKDTRTGHEERDAQRVLDGALDGFIDAYLKRAQ